MRWKLLLLSALIAACLGALTMIAASSLIPFYGESRAILNGIILLTIAIFPAIIVYRRTSKRRKTQAFLTILITVGLTVAILIAVLETFTRVFTSIAQNSS